jgi:two-component system, OmpR family, sensor histidine kinase VicK
MPIVLLFVYNYVAQTIEPARLVVYAIIILCNCIIAHMLISLLITINTYHQREKIYYESVGDGIFAIDTGYKITLWNKSASAISGWSAEEVIGRDFRDIVRFIHERDRSRNITFIEEAMLHGEVRHMEGKTLLITKSGKDVSVSDSAAPIFDYHRKVIGIIVVFQDVSVARELEKTKEEFISLAAHQLRTPAAAIKGYTKMLMDGMVGPVNPDQFDYLNSIAHANKLLLDLINAILNISRIEIGTLAINPQPLPLIPIAEEAIKEITPLIKQKNITFELKFSNTVPVINIDENVTFILFQNILHNAAKYTPENGHITCSIEYVDDHVQVSVADTGIGIPESQKNLIFTKMFRADNAVNIAPEGTGLELYMVKKLVDEFGGNIWFDSTEGKGSTFYIKFPHTGMKKQEGIRQLT